MLLTIWFTHSDHVWRSLSLQPTGLNWNMQRGRGSNWIMCPACREMIPYKEDGFSSEGSFCLFLSLHPAEAEALTDSCRPLGHNTTKGVWEAGVCFRKALKKGWSLSLSLCVYGGHWERTDWLSLKRPHAISKPLQTAIENWEMTILLKRSEIWMQWRCSESNLKTFNAKMCLEGF